MMPLGTRGVFHLINKANALMLVTVMFCGASLGSACVQRYLHEDHMHDYEKNVHSLPCNVVLLSQE